MNQPLRDFLDCLMAEELDLAAMHLADAVREAMPGGLLTSGEIAKIRETVMLRDSMDTPTAQARSLC